MQLFFCPAIVQGDHFLNQEESRHCVKSLRKKSGDLINITDGNGHFFKGELKEVSHKKCSFDILSKKAVKKLNYSIHIAISPTKSIDRIEWFVEKAVEIGIDKITFINSSHSERKTINIERVRKKAISAMKQSVRAFLPEINEITKLNVFLKNRTEAQKFIAHLESKTTRHLIDQVKPSPNYVILIGPEGGFSNAEISLIKNENFEVAKIGDYRLRTETAGVVACTILNNINNQL